MPRREGRYGLIGGRLAHSYSPQIHALIGDYDYELFELAESGVGPFLAKRDFDAVNVTIPYKKTVMAHLDRLDGTAERIGSVNTIIKEKDGTLTGHNTDFYGFSYMLKRAGIDPAGKNTLILGDGGASATVRAVLSDMGARSVKTASRRHGPGYGDMSAYPDTRVIVNTTPVGMYPDAPARLIDISCFDRLEGCADLIYNPARTGLILDAEKAGIRAVSGLSMLVAQAVRAAELFFGTSFDDALTGDIIKKLSARMMNIALIGMPGCGKTSVGKVLAERTGRVFADTDEEIEKRTGMTVPGLFAEYGEEAFRRAETEVLQELGKQSGLVIATGGGIVTKPENHELLRQNSAVFFLERDISALATEGRPLSARGGLDKMYEKRLPLYKKCADHTVDGGAGVSATADEILGIIPEAVL